eukprot:GEMP01042781.1.p1 GENE.GEMP01042781.1~~GEMP01042781.1.p1  ORF type:complete len:304 (+),score=21.22 GEMP01042781.1:44-955(+)
MRRCASQFFNIKTSIPQLATAYLYFFLCTWWNSSLQIVVDHLTYYHQLHGSLSGPQQSLPDLGFYYCPAISRVRLSDELLSVIIVISLLAVACHRDAGKIIKRAFMIWGTLFFIRGVTISMTFLPNPFMACETEAHQDESFMIEGLKVMTGQRSTCGDVLFSGHAAAMTLLCLFWFEYLPKGTPHNIARLIKTIVFLSCALGISSCICTKFHYSVDVCVGVIFSFVFFHTYHMMIRTPKIIGQQAILFRFLAWYECRDFQKHEKGRQSSRRVKRHWDVISEKKTLISALSRINDDDSTWSLHV